MRIGVCGGPYGNPYALRAFADDARSRGCERLYCLGDLGGFGAEIDELWPILIDEEIKCIAGNYDVAIARGDPDCGCGYRDPHDNEFAQLIYDYTLAHTRREFAAWMGMLPTEHREYIGGHDVHMVHGSPLALNDFWWESAPEGEHRLRVDASGAEVVLCSHSGLPWQRKVGTTLVVNVGVIGKPANDGRTSVWYAVVDLDGDGAHCELRPLDYDWRTQAASMRVAGLPEAFVETIETGWWTTCLEVLPPPERSRGRYHLYRSTLPVSFKPAGGTWGEIDDRSILDGDDRPVVPLFGTPFFPPRLWIYTNFHCNLRCDYCAVGSSPSARRRILSRAEIEVLVDQAVSEDFREVYFTGGEPLLHPEIVEILHYTSARLPTVLLTNAMLFRGTRWEKFRELADNPRLIVQTSLDGSLPATHDSHRGHGSWERTMEGIKLLVYIGLQVRVAMTETAENAGEVDELRGLLSDLSIDGDAFMVRPLLRRGYSEKGIEIAEETTVPEVTVTADGIYWHPAGADGDSSRDMRLAGATTSLGRAKQLVTERFYEARLADGTLPQPYRCAV